MADLSAFSSTSFSTTSWINASLHEFVVDSSESSGSADAIESYISSLTMKLHIMAQDYTDQLETAMVESMATMPRIIAEISRVEDQLKSIESEMATLSEQLSSLDQRNVAGVEDLSRLDTLKLNMEKCKATLEEHAQWSQLVREAKSMLESGGRLSDSADRIEAMFRSLDILRNLPGNEERQQTCEEFKESLLGALRPRLRRDVHASELSPLQEYLYVFQKLGREFELEEEYIKARPAKVASLWESYSPEKHENFPRWLAIFLGKVTRLLTDEEENVSKLFGSPKGMVILCDLSIEALAPLTKPASQSLCSRMRSLGSPESAFDSFCVTDEFVRRVLGQIEGGLSDEKLSDLLTAAYSGFVELVQSGYVDAETAYVKDKLADVLRTADFQWALSNPLDENAANNANTSTVEDLFGDRLAEDPSEAYSQYGERLLQVADSFLPAAEALLRRGSRMMGGLRVKQLVRALSLCIGLFVKHLTLKIEDLSVASGFTPLTSSAKSSAVVAAEDGSVTGGDLYNDRNSRLVAERLAQRLESSEIDSRLLIASALRAMQTVGRFIGSFRQLERSAKEQLAEVQAILFGPTSSSVKGSVAAAMKQSTSLGAAFAGILLQQDPHSSSELKSFLVASSSSSHHLAQNAFASVSGPLSKLRAAAGQLLFNLCIEAPEKMMGTLAQAEEVWDQQTDVADVEALRESMLPQSNITQVGEHMLSLVQELEAFASSEALTDLLVLKGEAANLPSSSSGWQQFKNLLDVKEDCVEMLCKRSSSYALVPAVEVAVFGSALTSLAGAEFSSGASYDEGDADGRGSANAVVQFVNEWLTAIADATVGLLAGQVAAIPQLSPAGCAQLLTDVEYLRSKSSHNVINAMGIRPHALLLHIYQILLRNPTTLLHAMDIPTAKSKADFNALLKFDQTLFKSLCKGFKLL